MQPKKNVLGGALALCSIDPMTGYFRDGCCNTDVTDGGTHTVCAVMTDDFLQFSKAQGNDLSTPRPQFRFPGLKEGDHWCVCAVRWKDAMKAGKAPKVVLEATHAETLGYVKLSDLEAHCIDA